MKTPILSAVLLLALGASAQAQIRYSEEEIIGRIAECMKETAPKDWRRLVFTLDQESADPGSPGKSTASHKVMAGKGESALRDFKPCRRPDWVSRAVQAFRESQDEKARGWVGITVTVEREGRYTINFRYPK
jgi:hypothetical protein